ncbi:MAG: type II toxin-antitoxin system RelE/ParE family toxin [Chlorobaculum sp.]|jgi:toxin ParE1/3/4|nr:type II toxin-antitoxin system RelE/ParE family toxin [Chlorobaculum sp.]
MPVILKRPLVSEDLYEIWEYIAEDSGNRADAFLDAFDKKFHELAESPLLGRNRPELTPGLMSYPFGRYVIFYLQISGGIEIVRVLHAARDIDSIFESE